MGSARKCMDDGQIAMNGREGGKYFHRCMGSLISFTSGRSFIKICALPGQGGHESDLAKRGPQAKRQAGFALLDDFENAA